MSEQDEVTRFEGGRRRATGESWGGVLFRHPSYYDGKKMDWTPAELAGCSDTELTEQMPGFAASREVVEA